MKERTDQLNLIKIKNSAKDTVKRMRRPVIDQEKKFAKDTSDKGLSYIHPFQSILVC